jgi:uncharacterized phage protein gp47/JayE
VAEPIYLDPLQTTEAAIRARQLARLPGDLAANEGDFPREPIDAATPEFALIAIALEEALRRGFAETTFGIHLERRAAEHGLDPVRIAAVASKVTIRFTAPAGTVIPIGTRVSTAATASVPAQVFATDVQATIAVGQTTVDVAATAEVAGTRGNVGAGQLIFLATPVAGVTAVTNPAGATGGADQETDAALLVRYLAKVRSPSAGGNRADYVNWALAVAGVGGVNVSFPGEGTPAVENGGVRVSLIGSNKTPASLAVQDAVLTAIVDPRRLGPYQAEAFAISGNGVTIDATQGDDDGNSAKMVYDAAGNGQITHQNLHQQLAQPGIWMVRPRAKVSSAAGATPFFRVGVWNLATGNWAKSSPSAADGTAVRDYRANELAVAFPDATYELLWPSVDFYWNGQDALEARIIRLQADNATQVWVDVVRYRSAFSSDVGVGKSPAGARVQVTAAAPIAIAVAATLTYKPGYVKANVDAAVSAALDAYLKSLAFTVNNDVQYARIGTTILDTPGVQDYTGLTVNGGAANIVVTAEQVAVLGVVTLP